MELFFSSFFFCCDLHSISSSKSSGSRFHHSKFLGKKYPLPLNSFWFTSVRTILELAIYFLVEPWKRVETWKINTSISFRTLIRNRWTSWFFIFFLIDELLRNSPMLQNLWESMMVEKLQVTEKKQSQKLQVTEKKSKVKNLAL